MNRGTLVLLPGIVRGMGQEAEIDVLTRRMQDHNTSGVVPVFKYADCSVIGGSDLPDGDYIVSFAGHSAVMSRHNGAWLAPGIAVPDEQQTVVTSEEAQAQQPVPRQLDDEEPEAEPPTLKLSPQSNGHRWFLV